MAINLSDRPVKYINLYNNRLDGFIYVYNPISTKGVIVLDRESEYIFNLIDGLLTVKDIWRQASIENTSVTTAEIKRIIGDFVSSQLIYLNDEKYRLKSIEERSAIIDPKLLRLWIHITNQCNLRCVYCFVHKSPEKMDLEMAKKAIIKIVADAQKAGYKEIVCNFGGGEPLLELKGMLHFIKVGRKEAKKNKILIRFGIVSNATLITDKVAAILKKEDIFVAVSMDGVDKYHNVQRPFASGGPSFKAVRKGIEALKKTGLRFNTTAVITSKNIKHLPTLTRYFLRNDIPFIYALYKDNPNSKEDMTAPDDQLIKYFRLAFNEIYKNPPRYSLLGGLLDLIILNAPHIHPCRSGRHYLVLRHDGTIAFCPVKIDIPTGTLLSKGSVTSKIHEGSILTPKDRCVNDIDICFKCVWKYACCGGCPLITKIYKNTYNSNSPLCHVFKSLIPDLLRIEAKRLIVQDRLVNSVK